MSRLHGYRPLLEQQVIEAWRSYRLVVTCGLFVALGIAAPVLTRFLPQVAGGIVPDEELEFPELGVPDVLLVLLPNLLLFGAIVAILLAMGSVATERERGTAALVLAMPVGRGAYLWARFVALAMQLGLATALSVLAAWLYTALLFEPLPVAPWVQLWLVVWLSTLVYTSITLMGSVVTGSVLGAAGIGQTALVVLTLAGAITTLAPWLPSGLADVAHAIALQEPSPDLAPSRTIAVSIGVVLVSYLVAWWRFARQDL